MQSRELEKHPERRYRDEKQRDTAGHGRHLRVEILATAMGLKVVHVRLGAMDKKRETFGEKILRKKQ